MAIMNSPQRANPAIGMSRVASTNSDASSSRISRTHTFKSTFSDFNASLVEAPRARHYEQLRGLASAAGIPLTLSKPLFSLPDKRAVPQNPSDKNGAEEYLMSLRPKKFLVGKSSKGFASDEIMLALDRAVKDNQSDRVIEALLRFAESSGIDATKSTAAFSGSKKGQGVPTMDYVFSQTESSSLFDKWHLFLGRVSQGARDASLAGALKQQPVNNRKVQALLEWGANPELCHDQVLQLTSLTDTEELVEILLLSPLLTSSDLLNQALIQAASCQSLRKCAVLLLRGADINYNNGEALRLAISAQCSEIALAMLVLSKRPASMGILDEVTGLTESFNRGAQKPLLEMLLYSGCTGPRTSRAITPYILERDDEIMSIVMDSHAFVHGSFPAPKMFQAAVELGDADMAVSILRQSRVRSFSDYANTGAHLQLVERYVTDPEETLRIISELLSLGTSGEYTSQMLAKACEPRQINSPDIVNLVHILIQSGGAKASYEDGKCMLMAIGASNVPLVRALAAAQPSKKALSAGVAHADSFLGDDDPAKLEIWSILLEAGASGPVIDQQLIQSIDMGMQALVKLKILLPASSLDYSDGEAILRAIEIGRSDILEVCLETKQPRTSLPWIWKRTRQMFAIANDPQYDLSYMQRVLDLLQHLDKSLAPANDLLLDAAQCQSKDIAFELSRQFIRWGGSPDHSLGASLVACVKRSDVKTLAILLLQKPNKTSLKYAFEEAISLRGSRRHEIVQAIVQAGLERPSLDAALPQILKEDVYDASMVHLFVDNGSKLHRSLGEHLVAPAKALDLTIVDILTNKCNDNDSLLLPLKAVLESRSDWQKPDGASIPVVKFLISKVASGAWADGLFIAQVNCLNQHTADLFHGSLSSTQVPSDALKILLSHDKSKLSREKLSMASYLFQKGASGDIVDEIYIQAVKTLRLDWVFVLDSHLVYPTTRLSAFETFLGGKKATALQGGSLEMVQFLLQRGVAGPAVDEMFIQATMSSNLSEASLLLPFVSSATTFSHALERVIATKGCISGDSGHATLKMLVENGASGPPLLVYTREAAKSGNRDAIELLIGTTREKATIKAAFEGLVQADHPLESPESRAILTFLGNHGLDSEDAALAARVAASRHDIGLYKIIESLNNAPFDEIHESALATIHAQHDQWLSSTGVAFVEYLLSRQRHSPLILQLMVRAAKAQHLSALKSLLSASQDKSYAATTTFNALGFESIHTRLTEKRSIMQLLLKEGAKGPAVENCAAQAARTSDYDTLDVLLTSPAAASVLPAAFGAVARDRSDHMSSEQLSIATILVKYGVSTELLAIAAIEAAKLSDIETLKVLSRSPRFSGVTDDTMRAMLLAPDLWCSTEGIRIIDYLFEVGVSEQTTEMVASKVASALDIDALRIALNSKHGPKVAEAAFASLIGLGRSWLCPEGLRIMDLLLQSSQSQSSIDNAFVQACEGLSNDAVNLLYPLITDFSVVNTALAKATDDGTEWLSNLHLIKQLLDSGVEGSVVESTLVKGARALHFGCVEMLSACVSRPAVYTQAFAAASENKDWRYSLNVIQFLLDHGAHGIPVDEAYVSAAGHLDYRAVEVLANHIDGGSVNDQAFSAAAAAISWPSLDQFELITFLHSRGVGSSANEMALLDAAKALNVDYVELLSRNAVPQAASKAFTAAIEGGNDWESEEGKLVLGLLAQRSAQGQSVEKTFVNSASRLRLDLVNVLLPNIGTNNVECISNAFNAVVLSNERWFSQPEALEILQILTSKGATSESATQYLIEAAQYGSLDAVAIIALLVEDPTSYMEAFNATTRAGPVWLQRESLDFVEFLLSRATIDDGLHQSLANATQEVVDQNAPLELLTLLLQYGADINYGNGRALQIAAQSANLAAVQLLIQNGADSTTIYVGLQEALCNNHDEQTVLDLFELMTGPNATVDNPDVNQDSELGVPLIFHCLKNYPSSLELAREVCNLGADLKATLSWGIYGDEPGFDAPARDDASPLLFALVVNASDQVITDVLLAYGADLQYVAANSQTSPLILAARLDRHEMLSKFLDRGARVSQKDCFDRTSLFYAARNGNTLSITSLLRKKPLTNDGSLHEAARELHSDAIKMLVAAGHNVNFPSLKHGGRNPLCELCLNCKGFENPVGLHSTLEELKMAKCTPLSKCRGRTALFFAIENSVPSAVVTKLLEVIMWQNHSDPSNVFEENDRFYSATMYIKKGICLQPQEIAEEVLDVLQDVNVVDRYYAKERMQQPDDAVGMPQRIADLDHKKWIRSSRLEQEQEDHERRLRREEEEMSQRDQLTTKRHLLTMEHREDVAFQTSTHNEDQHFQSLQFRSREHDQAMRYKDQLLDQRLDEVAAGHRLKLRLEQQTRGAQLEYDGRQNQQKLTYMGREQDLRYDGAQSQQQLRLGGISAENTIKNEQERTELGFRAQRGQMDRADMDYKLQHAIDVNADKVTTQRQTEEIARESQQRRNELDQRSRQSQLEYQQHSDDVRLRTQGAMNQYHREHDEDTIRRQNTLSQIEQDGMRNKHYMLENDRQNQLRFGQMTDTQKLNTLQSQGRIQNQTLFDRGRIENNTLREKNTVVHEGRVEELDHTAKMGQQRITNERGMGQARLENEYYMGQMKVQNEHNMGQQRIYNEEGLGKARLTNERNMGVQRTQNERMLGGAKAQTQAQLNQLNRAKLQDNLQAQAQGNRLNHMRNLDNVQTAAAQGRLNHARNVDNARTATFQHQLRNLR